MAAKTNLLTDLPGVITFMHLTTSVAGLISPGDTPSIRKLNLGGEMMTQAVRNSWTSRVQHLNNAYGPTETAVCVTI
ncbi:hypothetical protein K493DRAFT_314994 [Basidiobolus meristosporus CBS 931.73]|uniref:AMP-dependent synthetase/ligase domain-containing protein n=1 Tax=Basidiobolus meristosporus CBS 931.73 TaxID=1314790 RepID=A0A1Y1YBW4_9FUNG|nr:hypothetical protein K493DRAFT_314994 [Basidiobolus meristosporus CBS 931.73]|eukprot:ORX95415.1 hypothetical protein K493DRAFT_314994 [Basidiobolus meristosporus CBS 931.73]